MDDSNIDFNHLLSEVGIGSPNPSAGATRTGATLNEWKEIGDQAISDGDPDTAVRAFEKALELASPEERADIAASLAGALAVNGDANRAIQLYQEALHLKPDEANWLVGIRHILLTHGQYEEAIQRLERAAKLSPHDGYIFRELSEAYRARGFLKAAYTHILKAIECLPAQSHFHFTAADLANHLGEFDASLSHLKSAIDLSPGDDFLYFRSSLILWKLGEKKESIQYLRMASDLDPDKHLYHALLQRLLESTEQHEEASLEQNRTNQMDAYDRATLDRALAEIGLNT